MILDLGEAEIGFEGLRIRCSTENANSSAVYLLGLDSCLAHFDIYRLFALPGTAAIDVGANLGIHSLVLSACVGAGGRVHAFEPVAALRAKMEENLKINTITNVQLYEYALGNSIGTVSFRSNATDFNIGRGCVDPKGNLCVSMTTIDNEFRDIELPVSMLKIDTEGHELQVIEGAACVIEKHRPAILMEYNFEFYSLSELKRHIPMGYSYFELPQRSKQALKPFDGELPNGSELFIAPDGKLKSCPRHAS
jgi:FkbM family methyltransferase